MITIELIIWKILSKQKRNLTTFTVSKFRKYT